MIRPTGPGRGKLIASALLIFILASVYAVNSYAVKSEPAVSIEGVNWLKSVPVAHRGLHSNNQETPENSMTAFGKAMQNGYAIELDVQFSADKTVVVFHDYDLKRMTGVDKKVNEYTEEQLSKLKLLGSDENIPLFKEVLKYVDGKVPVLIEIKNEGAVGELEQAVYQELKDYKGEYAVQSFNPYSIKWFRENAPEVVRGQLSGGFKNDSLAWYKKILLKNLIMNFESRPAFVAYEISELPSGVVERLSKSGTIILGWTAKTKEDYDKALKYCDNVIFEGFLPK